MDRTLQKEYEELEEIKLMIESPAFQKFIVKPIHDELDTLKYAYDCQSLKELNTLKGKKQGLKFLIKILKDIDTQFKNARYDIDNSSE